MHEKGTNDFVGRLAETLSWIGGYRTGLGANDFVWTDGSEWDFINWASGDPDNAGRNPPAKTIIQGCVAISMSRTNFFWNDYGCLSRRHFICQLDAETICPSNTVPYLALCGNECMLNDCNGTLPSQEACLQCLETCARSNCPVSISVKVILSL